MLATLVVFAFAKVGVSSAGEECDPNPRVISIVARLFLVTNR